MRVALAAAAIVTAVVAVPSADAGPKVLDGVKVKNLSVILEAPAGATAVDPTPEQVASCKPPQCARIDFVFKPAKGVTDPLTVSEKNFWNGLGDEDLYLMQGTKVIASCTGTLSNRRYISVPQSALKPGSVYTAVMFVSHEIGESTSMNVDLPGIKAPDPVAVDTSKPFPDHSVTVCSA